MKNKGDLSTWTMKELRMEDRRWGVHDMNATEVRAEIARRRDGWAHRSTWISVIAAIVSALAAVVAVTLTLLDGK
jgi:hypothetical protein